MGSTTQPEAARPDGGQTPGARGWVLVVEDDREVLDAWKAALERAGWSVLWASCVEDALSCVAAADYPIRAFVVDVMLARSLQDLTTMRELAQERDVLFSQMEGKEAARDEERKRELRDLIRLKDNAIFELVVMSGGVQFVRQAQAQCPEVKHIPTFYVTARQDPDVREEARALHKENAWAWWVKPVDPDDLAERLSDLAKECQP